MVIPMDATTSTPSTARWAHLAPQLQIVPSDDYYEFFATAPIGTVVEHWEEFYRRNHRGDWVQMESIEQGYEEDDAELTVIAPSDLAYRLKLMPVQVLMIGDRPFI